MSILAQVVDAAEKHRRFVEEQVQHARTDPQVCNAILSRWQSIRASIPTSTTPTGLKLPRLALPEIDEAGEIARYLHGEGLPGEFPYANGAYREMYLEPLAGPEEKPGKAEEPTRLFAGMGLAEDTNERFRYLTRHQRSARLSTA
ncbi:MAG: putative adenosyl-cobalamine enzyme methylmalonyl-CoA mutase or isobutyryl-CoA mutase, partial [Phycisphaerales bacterium]|nr:putative adenosyl-cobalamine enzyme methylmalonyl-CoA mutase or isobutyryl-CoA mutase [Phycisphaerales bacterium]